MRGQWSTEVCERADFGVLCNRRGLVTAVEIGTDRGDFAASLCMTWGRSLAALWTVDDYRQYGEMPWDRTSDRIMAAVKLAPFAHQVRMLAASSHDAARVIPDPVHFVYIDGAHDRASVQADLDLWWPRIAPGGILAGHDYHPEIGDVIEVVDAFAEREGRRLLITWHAGEPASWYVYKGPEPELFPCYELPA